MEMVRANGWSDAETDALRSLFMNRVKTRKIARVMGRKEKAVGSKINRLGLPVERRKRLDRAIAQGVREGLSDYLLSSRLGVCRNTIRKHRKALGRVAP
jgi:hypothetical protein